jgi:hypothetical protein
MEKRSLVYPALVGKRLQKIEKAEDGNLYFHFASGVIFVNVPRSALPIASQFIPRTAKPEPLVIPAK